MRVLIRGAGVAGLTLAHELAVEGSEVEVAEIAAATPAAGPHGLPAACSRHGASAKVRLTPC